MYEVTRLRDGISISEVVNLLVDFPFLVFKDWTETYLYVDRDTREITAVDFTTNETTVIRSKDDILSIGTEKFTCLCYMQQCNLHMGVDFFESLEIENNTGYITSKVKLEGMIEICLKSFDEINKVFKHIEKRRTDETIFLHNVGFAEIEHSYIFLRRHLDAVDLLDKLAKEEVSIKSFVNEKFQDFLYDE